MHEGSSGAARPLARAVFGALLLAAFILFILWRTDNPRLARWRLALVDWAAPALETVAGPSNAVGGLFDDVRSLAELQAENALLRERVDRLAGWRDVAQRLEEENARLRALSNVKPSPRVSFVTAEVIGDAGGPFADSVLVNVGARDGVEDGAPALDAGGLVGRVAGAGAETARVLLLTDPASRVPVLIGDGRVRAILVGDETARPPLQYILSDQPVTEGERVVTSGDGGVLTAGLPIGRVTASADGRARVELFARIDRLEFLRLYGAASLEAAPPAPGLVRREE